MVSHLDHSVPSYPSWELTTHSYRRGVMNRVDNLRNESDQDYKLIQRKIQDLRQVVAEELQQLSYQLRECQQKQLHLTGQIRTELKHLPIIPVPRSWGLPVYQFGQRVLMTEYNLAGIVTGIDYSDGTVYDAGWHYQVKLDYSPIPRDEIESAIESDLKPLGMVNDSETSLSIVK